MSEGNEDAANRRWFWELIFGGGVVVWAIAATVTAIWWASAIDTTVARHTESIAATDTRIDGLDNVTLGNRITAVETQVRLFAVQQDRTEGKIDQLLSRQSRNP